MLGPSSKPGSWRLGREAPPEGLKQHGLTSGDVRACGGWVVPREGQGCARIPAQGTGLLRGHSFPGWCWVKYKWCTGSSPARASGAGLPAPPDSATGVQEVREGDGNFLASQPWPYRGTSSHLRLLIFGSLFMSLLLPHSPDPIPGKDRGHRSYDQGPAALPPCAGSSEGDSGASQQGRRWSGLQEAPGRRATCTHEVHIPGPRAQHAEGVSPDKQVSVL